MPEATLVLTLGCGKFRIFDQGEWFTHPCSYELCTLYSMRLFAMHPCLGALCCCVGTLHVVLLRVC